LEEAAMAYTTTTGPTVNGNGHISGRGLRHRKLTRTQRIRLAADLVACEARLYPSIVQASDWLNVTSAEVSSELKARAAARATKQASAALVEAWDNASQSELEAAVRAIGVAEVWDVLARVPACRKTLEREGDYQQAPRIPKFLTPATIIPMRKEVDLFTRG
jgi:hypothetical protein